MTRPDPNKIKLAGSGMSDKKYTSSVATTDPVESTQLIVPARCLFPVSNMSHETGMVTGPTIILLPQIAKGGSPTAPGGSERKVMLAVFERNVLPVIPRASLKVLPRGSVIPRVHRLLRNKLVLCGKVVPPKWVVVEGRLILVAKAHFSPRVLALLCGHS